MKILGRVGLAVCVAMLTACSAAEDDGGTTGDDANTQAGKADQGHPSVGLLVTKGGGVCTGTVFARGVVLTAAHCVTEGIEAFYTGEGVPVQLLITVAASRMKR